MRNQKPHSFNLFSGDATFELTFHINPMHFFFFFFGPIYIPEYKPETKPGRSYEPLHLRDTV
jgi:hypothetical protein